ncbi:acetylxylan esterase [Ruania alkalisoli]|uniref:Acetylxylan esterase n=1 Tax=Ruania alkalisoli TaxID=2779775 RepID=A0A7M1STI3_9MICO|nr:acetylxylan esterase [Ruania alkalisoli]QOR70815.1 acetylxylan esterase [Ruania alkalisoli]
MPLFDKPLAQLHAYYPDIAEPDDFDDFWQATLSEARAYPLGLELSGRADTIRHIDVFDVTFSGFGGHPIKAWYARPAGVSADLPLVVSFVGYHGGRGYPWDHTTFPSAGYGYLRVDSRGQGWLRAAPGHTPDPVGHAPAAPGVMTRGLESPADYYYRRLYTDAARSIEAGRELPGVAKDAVVVAGGSQGGGIAIAAAAIVPDVAGLMTDVPFLQHIRRAVDIVGTAPYSELTDYLAAHRDAVDQAWRTISYFDGVNMAARGTAPSLWSVALMDTTCPPSTVYASYNRYGGEKQIEVYPYNGHEGGGSYHTGLKLKWLAERF